MRQAKEKMNRKFTNMRLPKVIPVIGLQKDSAVEDGIWRGRQAGLPIKSSIPRKSAHDARTVKPVVKARANVGAGFADFRALADHVQGEKAVRYLLTVGVDPHRSHACGGDSNAPTGATPLMMAAGHGRLRVVRQLLRGGTDIQAVDEHGHNALFWALRWDKGDSAMELLRWNCLITDDVLCGPVRNGNKMMVEQLVRRGANPNVVFRRFDGDTLWPHGETLLGFALTVAGILEYPTEIIDLLVKAGADVNQPTEWFVPERNGVRHTRTRGPVAPLEVAIMRGLEQETRLLLKAGARQPMRSH